MIALEALEAGKMKRNGKGKKFRRRLGSWSPAELAKFIEYKAEELGKKYVSKENRHRSVFRCKNCDFELNGDLNASRNIKVLSMSEYFTFLSANRCGSMKLHS